MQNFSLLEFIISEFIKYFMLIIRSCDSNDQNQCFVLPTNESDKNLFTIKHSCHRVFNYVLHQLVFYLGNN